MKNVVKPHSINIYDFITANCYVEKGKLIPCLLISRRYTKTTKLFKIGEYGILPAIEAAITWYFANTKDIEPSRKSSYLSLIKNDSVEAHYADLIANKISSSDKEIKFSTGYLANNQPMYIKINGRNDLHLEYSLNLHIKKASNGESIRISKIPHEVDDYFETLTSYIAIVTNTVMNNELNPFYVNHLYILAKYSWFNDMVDRNIFVEPKPFILLSHYDHYWFYDAINRKLQLLIDGYEYKKLMPSRKRYTK